MLTNETTNTITLDRDEDEMWIAECPAIPGCVSQGETKDEALENINRTNRMKLTEKTLSAPPFPSLEWASFQWNGAFSLPMWEGFQSRQGAYGGLSSRSLSDGQVTLNLSVGHNRGLPTDEQISAYRFLLENQTIIRDTILKSVFDLYPQWKMEFGYDGEEAKKYMPDLREPNDLKNLMGVSNIHVLRGHKDGFAYIGFEFGCTWEDEHGLGVMIHRNRVVDIGAADAAFGWGAKNDGGEEDRDELGEQERMQESQRLLALKPRPQPEPIQLDPFGVD